MLLILQSRWVVWKEWLWCGRDLQARSQPSDDGERDRFPKKPFSGFENWSSQWLSRRKLNF